ncbi:MAG: hypothetical protein SF172_13230 [Burkholderiales bacterium]|nr:hypothetical protein [Burkholderiales bacterium]
MQGTLPGIESPPQPSRIEGLWFFALRVPETIASRITDLAAGMRARHGLAGQPLEPVQLHLPLQALQPQPLRNESWLSAGLRAAAAVRRAPFEVSLDRVLTLPAGTSESLMRSACALVGGDERDSGVMRLRDALGEGMREVKLRGARLGRYLPHVALLYDDTAVPQDAVEPISWTATEFVLIHQAHPGAPFIERGRWPLVA